MNPFKTNSKAALRPLRAAALIAVAIFALSTAPARATDFTWDGEYSNLWDTISGADLTNWSPDGMANPVPDADDNVFFNGAAPFTVELNGSRTVLSVNFDGDTSYALTES